ncbi:hypothetical protein HZF09_15495 [Ramlibacter sp. CGMCC 1.13660]|jgi:hypothetical protein|uniref:hypothetical protein n=1 Tax=Ramlibacter sp. CGMCC 1.13660 TaxID=2755558 RepID=UPI001794EA2D|nr:hypothetical protein [Ramlibacter sp. CGMCC 1.13660]MBA2963535.1 hypothetical protein [Ramlibacter sp. CGMCC 1.13660]
MPVTKVVRVYTGADQRSHFEDLELPMSLFELGTLRSQKTASIPVTQFVFRESFMDSGPDFHTPPRRQFVITLWGATELTVGDGSSRVFGPGDALFAEDLTGEGHRTRELLGPRKSLILAVPDSFQLHDLLAKR